MTMLRTHGMSVHDRLLVRRTIVNGCWVWSGSLNSKGYGRITVDKRRLLVHRVAWVELRGELPDGVGVLHTCDNPPCFNPEHLFLGDGVANMQDAISKGRDGGTGRINREKDCCDNGHEFTSANTRIDPERGRVCRECARIRNREYKARLRLARIAA